MFQNIACKSLCAASVCTLVLAARAFAQHPANDHLEIDPKNFNHSEVIDNKWWPKVGSQHVYSGFSVEGGEPVKHSAVETVTDLMKVIGGIRAAITLEEDYNDGHLEELEIAFHAQDKEGNVWHLGQLREAYEEKALVGGQVWFFDHPKGAKAGIRMWAKPKVGMASSQGFAPSPFNWTDRGRVAQMGQKTNVAAGSFDDVLVVEEWDEESPPGAFQTKWYAPHVGVVRVGFHGPDPEQEELELVKTEHLDESGMAKARAKALALEERAYMYAHTPHAERIPEKQHLTKK